MVGALLGAGKLVMSRTEPIPHHLSSWRSQIINKSLCHHHKAVLQEWDMGLISFKEIKQVVKQRAREEERPHWRGGLDKKLTAAQRLRTESSRHGIECAKAYRCACSVPACAGTSHCNCCIVSAHGASLRATTPWGHRTSAQPSRAQQCLASRASRGAKFSEGGRLCLERRVGAGQGKGSMCGEKGKHSRGPGNLVEKPGI